MFFNFLIDFYKKDTLKSAILFVLCFLLTQVSLFCSTCLYALLFKFEVKEIIKFVTVSFLLSFEQIILFYLIEKILIQSSTPSIKKLVLIISSQTSLITTHPLEALEIRDIWPDLYLKNNNNFINYNLAKLQF